MNALKIKFANLPADYAGLVALWPPRPLRDGVDERNVEEIVSAMAGHDLSDDQEDYLDLMSDLLLKYQSEAQISAARARRSPHERLKYLMQESEMTPGQLAKLLRCSQPLVSLVLGGNRDFSKENIKKLAAHFRLDAGYFL